MALAVALYGAGTSLLVAGAAHAQTSAAAQSYDIPAGSLTQTLNQFAQRAGVVLSFDPALTAGKQSNGLKGSYGVQQGFNTLLQGSGLELQPSGSGYSLRRLPAAGSATLPEVVVTAVSDGTTEGTGSYTTRATNTATKLNLSPRETPQSVSVVTRQLMEDQGMLQLTDAFKQVAGVTFVQQGSPGTDSNTVYSRGFPVENYQVDGVPQLNSWMLETADLTLYDRVEVLRGATGLLNGVGSPAATINLVRKRPTKEFQGSTSVTAGSWNFKRLDADISGALNDAANVRGRLVAAVQDNDSFIDRMNERKEIFYGALDVDISAATRLTFGLEYQKHNADAQARSGMPLFYSDGSRATFDRSKNSGANWAHSYQTHKAAFVALDHQFDNEWVLRANLGQSRRKYDDVVGYVYGTGPAGSYYAAPNRDGTGTNLLGGKWNAEYVQNALDVYASGPVELLGRKHEFVFGYNVSRTTYDAPWYNMWQVLPIANLNTWNGSTPGEPDWNVIGMTNFTETQSGIYGSGRFRLTDQLSFLAGVRVSNWKQTKVEKDYVLNTRESPMREENGVVTPYLGVVYDLNRNWSVYGSYTDIFKPQNNMTVKGDYVEPTTGVNTEIGMKSAFLDGRLNFSAAYFRVQQDNLAVIDGALLAPDGSQAYRAADGVKTTGYELEVSGEPVRGWNVSAGYTQRSSQDADGNNVNTEAPNNMFKLFTTYRIASVGNGLTVGGGARWQGDIYADGVGPNWDQRFTQRGYTVVDLMARYPLSKDVTLSANLNNVFDKEYYTTVYSGYYGAPRNVRVNLSYKF
jgi:outer membrane receptor for ferric coprogen and ferric-rhodotorulic acid